IRFQQPDHVVLPGRLRVSQQRHGGVEKGSGEWENTHAGEHVCPLPVRAGESWLATSLPPFVHAWETTESRSCPDIPSFDTYCDIQHSRRETKGGNRLSYCRMGFVTTAAHSTGAPHLAASQLPHTDPPRTRSEQHTSELES